MVLFNICKLSVCQGALRPFVHCCMVRGRDPALHPTPCWFLAQLQGHVLGLAQVPFLPHLHSVHLQWHFPELPLLTDFFSVSIASYILSQTLLTTNQSRDHCTHFTGEKPRLCNIGEASQVHTGGQCWWGGRNEPPGPKALGSLLPDALGGQACPSRGLPINDSS